MRIIVLTAVKEEATVIPDKSVYKQKVQDLLERTTYHCLDADPKARVLKRTKSLVKVALLDDPYKTLCD